MRILSMIFFCAFLCLCAHAQDTKRKSHNTPETTKTLHDIYKGMIPVNGRQVYTTLQLDHKPDYDMGGFLLMEVYKKHNSQDSVVPLMGQWTVLKGDAKNDNATVVELDATGKTMYYLRKSDGTLQKLDASLHEIKPPMNYILIKQ
jgi:uncharacterized protein YdaL